MWQPWCNLQQNLQSIRQELPSKQEADRGSIPIVRTITTKPNSIQELNRNRFLPKFSRMRTTLRPINPSNAPVVIFLWTNNVNKCRNIMLVHVTWRATMLSKNWIIRCVWNYFNGHLAINFKPLRPFTPVRNCDCWRHFRIVSAPTHFSRIVVGTHEAFSSIDEVVVRCWEVE